MPLLIALFVFLISFPSSAHHPHREPRVISVSASSSIKSSPDKVNLNFGLITKQKNPSEARTSNNKISASIISELKKLGISESNLVMTQFSISEDYKYNESTRESQIVGYTADKEFDLKLINSDLDKLNETLASVIAIVSVDPSCRLRNVRYGLSDDTALVNQASSDALKKAETKARIMVQALGAQLGKVASISETPSYKPPMQVYAARAMDFSAASESEGYSAGDIEVTANLDIRFFIVDELGSQLNYHEQELKENEEILNEDDDEV